MALPSAHLQAKDPLRVRRGIAAASCPAGQVDEAAIRPEPTGTNPLVAPGRAAGEPRPAGRPVRGVLLRRGPLPVRLEHGGVAEHLDRTVQFGPDGDLYVSLNGGESATGGGAVVRFAIDHSGGTLSYAGTRTVIVSDLVQPADLTFGTSPGDLDTLYVSESGAFDTNTQDGVDPSIYANSPHDVIARATSTPRATQFVATSGQLNYPTGLTWGPDGKLYVSDLGETTGQGQVLRYNADGSFDTVFTQMNVTGQWSLTALLPNDVLFDDQGRLLTANRGPGFLPALQGSVFRYSSTGVFLQSLVSSSRFPSTGAETPGISPTALALAIGMPPVVTVSALSRDQPPAAPW